MSWNDQGNNNGSRDPWGRNNNPPPDIDELIKKFRAQTELTPFLVEVPEAEMVA